MPLFANAAVATPGADLTTDPALANAVPSGLTRVSTTLTLGQSLTQGVANLITGAAATVVANLTEMYIAWVRSAVAAAVRKVV